MRIDALGDESRALFLSNVRSVCRGRVFLFMIATGSFVFAKAGCLSRREGLPFT